MPFNFDFEMLLEAASKRPPRVDKERKGHCTRMSHIHDLKSSIVIHAEWKGKIYLQYINDDPMLFLCDQVEK